MSKAAGKGGGADKLQQKSPAEFFAENKNIAGFDNVSCSTACHSA
jgi:DNA topoisomerase VI subunit B